MQQDQSTSAAASVLFDLAWSRSDIIMTILPLQMQLPYVHALQTQCCIALRMVLVSEDPLDTLGALSFSGSFLGMQPECIWDIVISWRCLQ